MAELQSARQKVVHLLGDVKEIEEAVVCVERHHKGTCYAVAYVDLADDVVGRAGELHDFQERILGDDFFGAPGDLRWNKYLYIVAGPRSLSHGGFEKAKAAIESDKEYARKHVVSEEELEALLGAVQHFTPSTAGKDFNVVGEWEKRLVAANLDELLDRPKRKDVVERIGTRSAKRVPVADKALTLSPPDTALVQNWLASISIDRFRPVHDGKSYTFGQVTLIVGPNGTGKTSLLEAIEYFYCGHNRRQGNQGTPKIAGSLVGNPVPLSASAEAGRIRARCFSWYNRDERYAKSILGAFTRYNFLDTDAAFRLSTELEPSEIPNDLSRLLVGSDAATIWDYLSKIAPEVETAHQRAVASVNQNRQKLDIAQKELQDSQKWPSNGKALTEAFHAALAALQWKASSTTTTPLATTDEAKNLQQALGHLQAVLAAGSGAMSLDAIAARSRELNLALDRARPLDSDRTRYGQEAKRFSEQALTSERASQTLDRWLTYLNSGFTITHARLMKAKAAADIALGRLGVYANGDIPEVPEDYESTPLNSALRNAGLNVRNAADKVRNLERLAADFDKVASARAQAAHQLQTAAQALFDTGHPKDDCPICHAKYPPKDLTVLINQITGVLGQSNELKEVTAQLAAAQEDLKYLQTRVNFLQYLQRIAETINLAPDVFCGTIPSRLVELRAELAKATAEFIAARKDWAQLANSGLTTNEYEPLRDTISTMLQLPESAFDVAVIGEVRVKVLEEAAAARKREAEHLEQRNRISRQLIEISTKATDEGWNTRSQKDGGMQTLVIMQSEVASVQNQVSALQGFMNIDSCTSLDDLRMGIIGASRIYLEAMQAIQIENAMSINIRALNGRIRLLKKLLRPAEEQAKNYLTARDTLKQLQTECSLERATQASLDAIGAQINEIFSRIHAPNEYEYVGRGEALLQTASSHERRTLEQVSTGQRAAFALSVFLAMNRSATSAPPVILIDDPIAHIDDLNALSFLDYLRDLAVNSNRQIFFATADTRIASLFARKFSFLGESFQTIQLTR